MAVSYLHGVETIEITDGSRPITLVKTSVIALVGIAPAGPKNQLIQVLNPAQAAQFGKKLSGFTIPQSLDAIFKQGAGTVLVVNVFDETKHTAQVTDEAQTVTGGKLKLGAAPIGAVTIKTSAGAPVTYVKDTDYSIDEFGNFLVLSSAIPDSTALKFSYKKLDAAEVDAADLIGAVDPATDGRTGMALWELALTLFGYTPKILIAPLYSSLTAISTELISQATKYRAIAYIDAPYGTTVAQAIAGRGPSGSINFNTSSKRAELLFPYLKWYDVATEANADFPYSAFKAGVRAAVDINEGYWVSDSNHEILGIVGLERNITSAPNDPQSDGNQLNAVGITTIYNSFGSGIKVFGNRSAAYPSSTAADNFVCVRRTFDILHESVEFSCMQFLDKPINRALRDAIRDSVNSFIRTLVGRGALVDGECTYNPDKNPAEEIAAGHLVFDIEAASPTPGERITFESRINIELLQKALA